MAANKTVIAIEVEKRIRHSKETECNLSFISGSFANGRVDSAVVRRIRIVVTVLVVVRNDDIAAF